MFEHVLSWEQDCRNIPTKYKKHLHSYKSNFTSFSIVRNHQTVSKMEPKPRNVERRLPSILLWFVVKNTSTKITQRKIYLRNPNIYEKKLCCVFGRISLVSCIMSYSNLTQPILALQYNWWDWVKHLKKHSTTTLDMTKLFSWMIMLVPILRRRWTPTWEVLPHLSYSPDIATTDYHLFWSIALGFYQQHFTLYEDTKNS